MQGRFRASIVLVSFSLAVMLVAGFVVGCGETTTTTMAATTTAAAPTTTASTAPATTATTAAKIYKIGMTQIVSHPTLDVAREAIIEGLKMEGFEEGKNIEIDFQNAQGDMAIATSIGQKFANDKKDIVISITTPVSQAMAKTNPDRPIVFCLVTDPLGAGLLKNLAAPEGNITGINDRYQIEEPSPADQGTAAGGQDHRSALQRRRGQLDLARSATKRSRKLRPWASRSWRPPLQARPKCWPRFSPGGRVDVISITTDNTIVSALEAVLKVADENDIPVVVCDVDSVERGALAAYGMNNVSMGNKAGVMAGKILKGTPVAQLPVDTATDYELMINLTAAKAEGVTVPAALIAKAVKVIE